MLRINWDLFLLNHVNSLLILPHYNNIWPNITINN